MFTKRDHFQKFSCKTPAACIHYIYLFIYVINALHFKINSSGPVSMICHMKCTHHSNIASKTYDSGSMLSVQYFKVEQRKVLNGIKSVLGHDKFFFCVNEVHVM